MLRASRLIIAALIAVAMAAVTACREGAAPTQWNWRLQTLESPNGLPMYPVGGVTLTMNHQHDNENPGGTTYWYFERTRSDAWFYAITGRYGAQWLSVWYNGPCGGGGDFFNVNHRSSVGQVCFYVRRSDYAYDSSTDGYFPTTDAQGSFAGAYGGDPDVDPVVPDPADGWSFSPNHNQGLNANQTMYSENGRFALRYQLDGNLVVYDTWSSWAAVWDSGTVTNDPGWVRMQSDGNFVIHNSGGTPIWATGTSGNSGAYISLLDNGTLMLFSSAGYPLWWSNSGGSF